MKVFYSIFFLCLFIFSSCSTGSEKQNPALEENKNVDLVTLVGEFNRDHTEHPIDATYYKGNIDIKANGDQIYLLYGDKGNYSNNLALQFEKSSNLSKLDLKSGTYEIAHLYNVVIIKGDDKSLYISTDENTDFDGFENSKHFTVMGISKYINSSKFAKLSLEEALKKMEDKPCGCKSAYLWTDNDPTNDPDCYAGGEFASSCGIEGECWVTCSGASYACCNKP
ncbi:hypothetical protein [Christiangramia portivictoriae]|uniref:hypothetical protein n=1 Tax=Christiangramia portivictoriae TaxID=326069 RepID=UPI000421700A|nr:hypothetical protein [Christiangramia portivictoriae]